MFFGIETLGSRRWRVAFMRFPLAALVVATLGGGVLEANGRTRHQPAVPSIDDAELDINRQLYQGKVVSVEGDFECLNETRCEFLVGREAAQTVTVDIGSLTPDDRYRLVKYCYDDYCHIAVKGLVADEYFIASEVFDIWDDIAMHVGWQ